MVMSVATAGLWVCNSLLCYLTRGRQQWKNQTATENISVGINKRHVVHRVSFLICALQNTNTLTCLAGDTYAYDHRHGITALYLPHSDLHLLDVFT